jgi:hypothetical protein
MDQFRRIQTGKTGDIHMVLFKDKTLTTHHLLMVSMKQWWLEEMKNFKHLLGGT